jgi:hypothetical protein
MATVKHRDLTGGDLHENKPHAHLASEVSGLPTPVATVGFATPTTSSTASTDHAILLPLDVAVYSGKFVVRLPRSLHRSLVEGATREGGSLNVYVTAVLARATPSAAVERRLDALAQRR